MTHMLNILIRLMLHLNFVQINASFENNVPYFLILNVENNIISNKYTGNIMIT